MKMQYKIILISWIQGIIVVALIYCFFLAIWHQNDIGIEKLFSNQNWFYAVMGLTILVGMYFIGNIRFVKAKEVMKKRFREKMVNYLILTMIGVMIIQIAVGFFSQVDKFAFLGLELFLFHISAAIIEEIIFRVGFLTLFLAIVTWLFYSRKKSLTRNDILLARILAIILSASVFMMMHRVVYGESYLLMLSTFLGGVVLGAGYVFSGNNLFVSIIPHVLNNAIIAGITIWNLSLF